MKPATLDKEENMQVESILSFGRIKFDRVNERLWRGTQIVPLRPKPFAILRYLVGTYRFAWSPSRLLRAIWPDTIVSEGVLKNTSMTCAQCWAMT